ncbi:hypothetical protein SAMN02927900_01100 [Rhizobium mongolense subsp. loessense]|jgi:hypothetical protein|uniref:Uncharacterized protein n=1 Tax=Rhizobium mongolense subsp. loessense TaxID=158890 RepID=A0A1G4PY77_9HYPH|nr:hypothetical protein [Rhizobium mongolense]SCW37167.1 hypothetical protein SAMN02927900_01100 [Rhizobium mongolense subsp. loessense]
MFMRSLIRETQRLADMFTVLEALRNADEHGNPRSWNSPVGLLEITQSCAIICDLAAAIAKAGYRECDRPTLEEITSEARKVLYSVNMQGAA